MISRSKRSHHVVSAPTHPEAVPLTSGSEHVASRFHSSPNVVHDSLVIASRRTILCLAKISRLSPSDSNYTVFDAYDACFSATVLAQTDRLPGLAICVHIKHRRLPLSTTLIWAISWGKHRERVLVRIPFMCPCVVIPSWPTQPLRLNAKTVDRGRMSGISDRTVRARGGVARLNSERP